MDEIVADLAAEHRELARMLDGLTDDDWQRATPCEGWNVADVVVHLAQSDELALASVHGRFPDADARRGGAGNRATVDEQVAWLVDLERGVPASDLYERWTTTASALCDALRATSPHERVMWVTGALSARTLTATRISECWIHSGDVADALGITLQPSDRLFHVARLAWRTLPYAFARAGRSLQGPVALELRSPDGEVWRFVPESPPDTTIRGDAVELCLVAARRRTPDQTGLSAEGPDGDAALELIRTYA
jgi:uncharacterized protein (TIGR03084 family)